MLYDADRRGQEDAARGKELMMRELWIAAQLVGGEEKGKEVCALLREGPRRCEGYHALSLSALPQGTQTLTVEMKVAKPRPCMLHFTTSS